MFRCPHCGEPLETGERAWRCANGHSFDVARQGYVALERKAARGDTAEMVAARVAFLEAGHYARSPTRSWPRRGCGARTSSTSGPGPGYYLAARCSTPTPDARGFALDSSRPALRRAARAHPQITAVACDIWDALPLQDDVADVVLNVFAPRNAAEMRRVLKPDGRIVVVTPTERHLHELELLRVHPEKRERLHRGPRRARRARRCARVRARARRRHAARGRWARARTTASNVTARQRVTVSVTVTTFRG